MLWVGSKWNLLQFRGGSRGGKAGKKGKGEASALGGSISPEGRLFTALTLNNTKHETDDQDG